MVTSMHSVDMGNSGLLTSAESYNPSTKVWEALPNMPQARTYFAAAAGGDGRLYVLGGYLTGYPYGVFSTVNAFDPVSHSWNASPVANMLTGRAEFARPREPTAGSTSWA